MVGRKFSSFDNQSNDNEHRKMTDTESLKTPGIAPFEQWLDTKLKNVYGAVLEEPIPDDLINLLREKLDKI